MGGILGRWQIVKNIYGQRWVKWVFGVSSGISLYDSLVTQLVPKSIAAKFPKFYEVIGMTSGFLPWWAWLLVLAAILVIAALEYAYRSTRLGDAQSKRTGRMPLLELFEIAASQFGWNMDPTQSEDMIDFAQGLRQAALDRTLALSGRDMGTNYSSSTAHMYPLVPISADYFIEHWVWPAKALENNTNLAMKTLKPVGDESHHYRDLHVEDRAAAISWLRNDAQTYKGYAGRGRATTPPTRRGGDVIITGPFTATGGSGGPGGDGGPINIKGGDA